MLNIQNGIQKRAIKVVIYGSEGIGKSTLASKFPYPLFIDTENGTNNIDVRRIICNKSYDDLLSIVNEVIANPTILKTLVIDTADWCESLVEEAVCIKNRVASIESIAFGKGYTYVADEFSRLLKLFDKLIELGVNVVLVAHAKPRKFELPEEQGQFDRYEMKLTRQVAPLVKEWCDMLLFCNYKTYVITSENGKRKAQGGKRVMYTSHHPCWDAKNRFGLPEELEMDFSSIAHLFAHSAPKKALNSQENPAELTSNLEIRPAVKKVKDLLNASGISEDEFLEFVHKKGHFAGEPLENFSDDFIARWVVPHFKKIVAQIKNNGGNN